MKKFISYVLVGGLATVVEWLCYWLFRNCAAMPYMLATTLAIVISTFSNWCFGRLLTFRHAEKKYILAEIFKIYVASAAGLLLNLLIMWVLHGQMHMMDMLAKIIATGIVFLYNYFVRILLIYKKKNDRADNLTH